MSKSKEQVYSYSYRSSCLGSGGRGTFSKTENISRLTRREISRTPTWQIASIGRPGGRVQRHTFRPASFASDGPISLHRLRNCYRNGLIKCRDLLDKNEKPREAIAQQQNAAVAGNLEVNTSGFRPSNSRTRVFHFNRFYPLSFDLKKEFHADVSSCDWFQCPDIERQLTWPPTRCATSLTI